MADLLAKWLNEDIKLSEVSYKKVRRAEITFQIANLTIYLKQTITDFESDFSSGYLLGELLYKFNQLDNFNEFS